MLFVERYSLHSIYNIENWEEIKRKIALEWLDLKYMDDSEKF